MAPLGPTGTIPATTAAALSVLEDQFEDEWFQRDDAIEALHSADPTDAAYDVDDTAATRIRDCTRADADSHIQTLLDNGYLYIVDDELRITPG